MNLLKRFFLWQLYTVLGLFIPIFNPLTLAQEVERTNPLTSNFSSNLIPSIDREITDFENKRIRNKINELNSLANTELANGNDEDAFSNWYEAINLSRYLGTEAEIKMINQVGEIAWNKSRNQDLNFLTERLIIIENQATQNQQLDQELLAILINAHDVLHNIDKSINLNQSNLEIARNNNDNQEIKSSLDRLGNLYLAKFDYYSAEPIFQELLAIARTNEDYLGEGIYLRKLAEISQALVNPENSVRYKEELLEYKVANLNINSQDNSPNQNLRNLASIAILKIAIGDDYTSLNNPQSASQFYQDAFTMAWSGRLFAIAGDALKKLGKLYQEYEQWDSALQIYRELIKIEQQSYNLYGLMNTYDYMGTIYKQKENNNQALQYWQKALEIARHLDFKEDYFFNKISNINIAP